MTVDVSRNAASPRGEPVSVIGAGIAGSWVGLLLAEAGYDVTVYERSERGAPLGTSHWAGGMLAPDCESDGAEPAVVRLGRRSVDLWRRHFPDLRANGSLVVSHPRDRPDLARLSRQTAGHEWVDAARIASLEPALAGRFAEGLFFPGEASVEPRLVLPLLHGRIEAAGGRVCFASALEPEAAPGRVVDCRGLASRAAQPALRGVRGETVLVETAEIALSRPVRLAHPRWPIYVIPREGNRFLVGATTIESEDASGISVRSALELMTAAFTLHPAFGEARVIEMGAALRPAFPDHAPRVEVRGERISVNGLYRHGFLVAPALGEIVVRYLADGTRDNEVMAWS